MRELSVISGYFKKLSDMIASPDFHEKYKERKQAFTRDRKISYEKVMLFSLSLHQRSLRSALDDFLDMNFEEDDSRFTKQAFSKARKQVNPEAFHEILRFTTSYIEAKKARKRWNGYRILAIDGTTLQLPNSKANKETFDVNINTANKEGKVLGIAMARATALFDVTNDLILDAVIGKRYVAERTQAVEVLKKCTSDIFNEQTIVLFDRGYPVDSLYHFFFERNGQFLMRISENIHSKKIKNLPMGDNLIDYNYNGQKKQIRVLRFMLDNGTEEYLITNVLDKNLTVELMKKLYFLRWGVESKYKELKTMIQIENFSGTSPTAVLQEFFAALTVSNIVAWIKTNLDNDLKMKKTISERKRKYQINRSYLAKMITKHFCNLLKSVNRKMLLEKIAERSINELSIIREDRKFERNPNRNKSRIKYPTSRRTAF